MFHVRVKTPALLAAFCLSFCLTWPASPAKAQDPSRPFGTAVQEWNRSLDLIERELAQRTVGAPRSEALRKRLAAIRQEATGIETKARAQMKPLRARLDALGPPPEEGSPPEPESLSKERQTLVEEVALYDGRVKQSQLILARVGQIQRRIQARAFERLVSDLLRRGPVPVAPATIARAVPEFLSHLGRVARSPLVWWSGLTPEHRDLFLFERLLLVLVVTLGGGWLIRSLLLRWFGHDPAVAQPAYTRRLAAALATGLANGVIPALILAGILYRVTSEDALASGLFQESLAAFCIAAIFFALAWALPRAVLSPDVPAWRMVPIPAENARVISRRVAFLAAVLAFDLFFRRLDRMLAMSEEMMSFYLFAVSGLAAIGVLALMRGRLWAVAAGAPDVPPDPAIQTAPALDLRPLFTVLRFLIAAVAVVVIPISLAGYVSLGTYLIESLVISGAVVGALALVRGLGREVIGAAMRSEIMRDKLAFRHGVRQILKLWVRILFDLSLLAGAVVLVLMVWGVPAAEIRGGLELALAGLTIGGVTLSLTDLLAAIAIFTVTLIVTRLIKRLLSERILPRTRFDIGVRNSLATGFGYLGIILALVLGVAALGLDLSSLAIIAGALSVGIGFGLQNVVNNFVSGLILLIERPIKVGDWIVCGQHEGFVKRIQLRATEIETFQRASIIVPNAELVSQALVNWTHKDRFGRVDVPVQVAYGSDAEQVMAVLETCLKENETILKHPSPWTLFRSFGENGLGFEARGFIANIEQVYTVETELRLAIYSAFAEAGIEIPLPQRDIRVPDAERLARALGAGGRPPESAEPAGGGGPG